MVSFFCIVASDNTCSCTYCRGDRTHRKSQQTTSCPSQSGQTGAAWTADGRTRGKLPVGRGVAENAAGQASPRPLTLEPGSGDRDLGAGGGAPRPLEGVGRLAVGAAGGDEHPPPHPQGGTVGQHLINVIPQSFGLPLGVEDQHG